MKCSKEIRQCPNGWTDCNLCANLKACEDGTYTAELEEHELETDLGIVIEEVIPVVQDVPEAVESVRGTWAERLAAMTEEERWQEYFKYHPPNLLHKEPYKAMSGAIVPGGGGKCRVPKKPKKQMPEYLKTFGQQL